MNNAWRYLTLTVLYLVLLALSWKLAASLMLVHLLVKIAVLGAERMARKSERYKLEQEQLLGEERERWLERRRSDGYSRDGSRSVRGSRLPR